MYIYVSDVSPKALIHAMNFIQKRENESKRSGVMICYHDKKTGVVNSISQEVYKGRYYMGLFSSTLFSSADKCIRVSENRLNHYFMTTSDRCN